MGVYTNQGEININHKPFQSSTNNKLYRQFAILARLQTRLERKWRPMHSFTTVSAV